MENKGVTPYMDPLTEGSIPEEVALIISSKLNGMQA